MTRRPERPARTAASRGAVNTSGKSSKRAPQSAGVSAPAIEETPPARATANALGLGLALLLAARAAFAFVPTMWAWGFNLQRFVPTPVAWVPWAIAALALTPAVGRRIAPMFARAGEFVRDSRWGAHAAFAVIAALATWLLPDQTHYVGDFQIRLGAAAGNFATRALFPQALPLDIYLHDTLPHLLAGADPLRVVTVIRAMDSIEAAALGIAAVMFARALELRGIAAFAAACVVLFGGYLGLFTGYGKAFTELCVLTTLVGAFGLRVARQGRGWIAFGLTTALAFTIHRSAVALLVPAVAASQLGIERMRGVGAPWRRPAVIAGIALPLVTLAAMMPRIARAMHSVDRAHFLPDGIGPSGVASAAIAPVHLADIVSVIALLSPLALIAPALAWFRARAARPGDRLFFFALTAPFIGMLVFIHPRQGVFRDWDVFASAGIALSLATAWLIGETISAAPRHAWLGVAVALGAIAPTTVGRNDARRRLRHPATVANRQRARVELQLRQRAQRRARTPRRRGRSGAASGDARAQPATRVRLGECRGRS